MVKMPEKKWLTRKEIIQQTGLSGPELDEYIAVGVLPEPVSGRADADLPGMEKTEMFPASVIWRVNLVNRLKHDGESMESISGQFGDISMVEEMTFPGKKNQKSIPEQNSGIEPFERHLDMDNIDENEAPILLEKEVPDSPVAKPSTRKNSRKVSTVPLRLTAQDKEKMAQNLFGSHNCSAVSLCVLAIHLQNLDKVADALMPEAYFTLLNQMNRVILSCVTRHNGIKAGCGDDHRYYYFFKQPETDYIMDSLACAFAMQAKVADINRKRKKENQVNDDILTNIGIAEGTEFAGILKFDGEMEFKVLGETPVQAGRLCEFGRDGEIWATKSGIGKIASEDARTISFGIQHTTGDYVPNVFSKIKNIIDEASLAQFSDIGELTVTCVKEIV